MKETKLLLTFISATILFSCNSNTGQKSTNDSADTSTIPKVDDFVSRYEDSIKKAEALAIEYFRQDSIDALQIKGYSVKKLSGKHKYGGSTKIEYQSLPQLLDETKKRSEKEMWTKEQFQSEIEMRKIASAGGQIRLDIERTTIGSANTEYFTVIIKDSEENELFRETLKSDVPNPSRSNDNWWNIALCSVDKRIKAPFYVYIVDALEEAPFKFEVTAIKK